MALVNLLENIVSGQCVYLPSHEGFSDLAFQQGWRIKIGALEYRCSIPVMSYADFYRDYLDCTVPEVDGAKYMESQGEMFTPYYEGSEENIDDLEDPDFDWEGHPSPDELSEDFLQISSLGKHEH